MSDLSGYTDDLADVVDTAYYTGDGTVGADVAAAVLTSPILARIVADAEQRGADSVRARFLVAGELVAQDVRAQRGDHIASLVEDSFAAHFPRAVLGDPTDGDDQITAHPDWQPGTTTDGVTWRTCCASYRHEHHHQPDCPTHPKAVTPHG